MSAAPKADIIQTSLNVCVFAAIGPDVRKAISHLDTITD